VLCIFATRASAFNEDTIHHAFSIVEQNQEDVQSIQTLLDNGDIDVDVENDEGETLLHTAAEKGHINIAEILILRGADMHKLSAWQQTPLHLATLENKNAMVKMMCQYGVNVNSMSNTTPTHCCTDQNTSCIQTLTQFGADVNAINHFGQTPCEKAQEKGNQETITFLETANQKNADIPRRIMHEKPQNLIDEGAQITSVYKHATSKQREKLLLDFRLYSYLYYNPSTLQGTSIPHRALKAWMAYGRQCNHTRIKSMTRNWHTADTLIRNASNQYNTGQNRDAVIGSLPAEMHQYIAEQVAVEQLKDQ
jgi:hypothetical protein